MGNATRDSFEATMESRSGCRIRLIKGQFEGHCLTMSRAWLRFFLPFAPAKRL
jgi:hypothetical protein